MVRIQNDFHNGVHSLFPEITDAFFIDQPLDVDGLSILMPSKTAPENIVKGVQVTTDLSVQAEGKYSLHLVIKAGHVRKAAPVDDELLPLWLLRLHGIPPSYNISYSRTVLPRTSSRWERSVSSPFCTASAGKSQSEAISVASSGRSCSRRTVSS